MNQAPGQEERIEEWDQANSLNISYISDLVSLHTATFKNTNSVSRAVYLCISSEFYNKIIPIYSIHRLGFVMDF